MANGSLTDSEVKILRDSLSSSFEAGSTVLSTILKKETKIVLTGISSAASSSIRESLSDPFVVSQLQYSQAVCGPTAFLFEKKEGALIADLMMGGEGSAPPEEIDDVHLGAVSEVTAQMIGACSKVFEDVTGKIISLSTPETKLADFSKKEETIDILKEEDLLKVTYSFSVKDLFVEGKLIQLMPISLASEMVSVLSPLKEEVKEPVFEKIIKPEGNLALLMDVPMRVTVELGRTSMLIKDILGIGIGSVVELERLVDEPADLLVNGRLIARGQVVLIDDNFGFKITELVGPGNSKQ